MLGGGELEAVGEFINSISKEVFFAVPSELEQGQHDRLVLGYRHRLHDLRDTILFTLS